MRIKEPIRRIPWPVVDHNDPEALVTREWLVTNGLGGYESGTAFTDGMNTAVWVGAALVAVGSVAAFAITRRPRRTDAVGAEPALEAA